MYDMDLVYLFAEVVFVGKNCNTIKVKKSWNLGIQETWIASVRCEKYNKNLE